MPRWTARCEASAVRSGFRRAEKLRQDGEFVRRLLRDAEDAEADYGTSGSVEEQIYEGFVGRQDERLMASFHTVPSEGRVEMIRQFQDAGQVQTATNLSADSSGSPSNRYAVRGPPLATL